MDIQETRKDFPVLAGGGKKSPVAYLDNACMSLKPRAVIDAVNDYYVNFSSCGGRSVHALAEGVSRRVDEVRQSVAKFIGARRSEEIIFTRNTTEAINIVAQGFEFSSGDRILTSDKEHNSNFVPWQRAAQKSGAVHEVIPSHKDGTFDLAALEKMMDKKVKMVALGWSSNLDGTSIPVREVIRIAHQSGAKVLLDAAQTVPHQAVNVKDLDVDFLAFSGHKMLGPTGTGVLYGKADLLKNLSPLLSGGGAVAYSTYTTHEFQPIPDKFEAGLQDYAGIFGLGAAVGYLQKIKWDDIIRREHELNAYVTAELQKIDRVHILGPKEATLRGGVCAFWVEKADAHQIAIMLSENANIAVRSGQFCVHSWFASRGIESAVRASFYFYNTPEEAQRFVEELGAILRIL